MGSGKCLRIAVYAIAKDEEKFAERWMESMREADGVFVMDTGSGDRTADILRSLGAEVVERTITPWRFDVARNESMRLVPDGYDVLVCTDLDEILCRGWRARLESAWLDALSRGIRPTTGTYEYVWSFNADGTDGVKFRYKKVHAPGVAKWTHPVHEVLDYDIPEVDVEIPGMRLEHHADPTKSRDQYLGLLRMSCEESPNDDRNAHYYGRELMFHHRWDEAIAQLRHHLAMPTATWRAERAASMRYIAKCLIEGKMAYLKGCEWLMKAMREAPNQREAAIELAGYADGRRDYQTVVEACEFALRIKTRDMSYTTKPESWGARPWDLYSVALYHVGRLEDARKAVREAARLAPNDVRIARNAEIILNS